MANTTIADLQKLLKDATYTPKSEAEIKAQAETEYKSYYEQLRLAAQQQTEKVDSTLQQQRDALAASYAKQSETTAKEFAGTYSTAGREQLSRGLQRSSFGAQTLANINTEGAKAQQAIASQQVAAETDVDKQRSQLASQLATQLMQYDASQAADVLKRMSELEDKETDRTTSANQYRTSLALQIQQLIYQQERDSIEDQQWERQFNESIRQFNESQSSRSSGRRSSKSTGSNGNKSSTWGNVFAGLRTKSAGRRHSAPTKKTGSVDWRKLK